MKRLAVCCWLLCLICGSVCVPVFRVAGAGPDFAAQTAAIRSDLYALHGVEAQAKITALLNSGSLAEPQKSEAMRLQEFALGLIEWNQWVKARFSRFPAGEIMFGDTGAYVVESDAESMTIHMNGQTIVCKPDCVPRKLAEYLVRKRLSDPQTQRLFGIYLCMYPRGDRARARQLWDSAQQRNIDCSRLYPELDIPIPASAAAAVANTQTIKTDPVPQRSFAELNNPAFLKPVPSVPPTVNPSTPKANPVPVPISAKPESAGKETSNSASTPAPVAKPVPASAPVAKPVPVKKREKPRPDRSGQKQFPPKVQYLVEDAIKAFMDEEYKRGRSLLMEASCMDIKATDAEFLLGLSYVFFVTDLDLARYSFEECLARNPKMAEAYNNLAMVQILQSRFTEALTSLKKAQELSPNALEILQNVCLWIDQIDLYSGNDKKAIRKELESMKNAFDDVSRYNPRRGWKYMKSNSETGRNPILLKIFSFRNSEGKRIGMPYEDIRNVTP